jgi:sodium/hydrogen exchanger-like protein 6/7
MDFIQRWISSVSIKRTILVFLGYILTCGKMAEAIQNYYLSSLTAKDELEYFAEKRAKLIHHIDTVLLLLFISLMVIIVLTAWFFKHHRFRFINETGLTLIYGMIAGYIIRFTSVGQIKSQTLEVMAANWSSPRQPPDFLRLGIEKSDKTEVFFHYEMIEGFFADSKQRLEEHVERKTVFSAETFFNIILPPVIFNAGYSLKKRQFFRNIGSILSFVFIGATLSSFFMAFLMYFFCTLFNLGFKFQELLFFGSILSATDPLTVLAIFNEMHVEVDLYALVFGESALNDAVAIVMSTIIETYSPGSADAFDLHAVAFCIWSFFYVFFGSLLLGCAIGFINALLTKFTSLTDYPTLETGMFILISYVSFLLAEVVELTGIVAVLFCGICQAHYTYNNMSEESQQRTKQIFDMISFLFESFVFLYIGIAVMTSNAMQWNIIFIVFSMFTMFLSRALWVYPLCTVLNFKRRPRIPMSHQHMIVFAGLRGAVPFALASRNTSTKNRQIMLATTSLAVIFTVLFNGGLTSWMIDRLGIKHGVAVTQRRTEEAEELTATDGGDITPAPTPGQNPWDKSFLPRKWYNFDAMFMKPLLTHANPTLMETMPNCMRGLARILTTERQMNNYSRPMTSAISGDNLTDQVVVHPESAKDDEIINDAS